MISSHIAVGVLHEENSLSRKIDRENLYLVVEIPTSSSDQKTSLRDARTLSFYYNGTNALTCRDELVYLYSSRNIENIRGNQRRAVLTGR